MRWTGRVRRLALLAALPLLLAACTPGAPVTAPTSPAASPAAPSAGATASAGGTGPVPPLSFADCGDGFECASLPVPLEPGEELDLAVLRRPAVRDRIGVLVVNPGGPGVGAVEFLRLAWTQVPEPVRARFDLVAFDPRGVGQSGAVDCASTAELDAYYALDPTPDDPGELEALVEGSAALARGCAERSGDLLPHVSTQAAAEDMDRLRAALGEERLSYLGYSYGSAIGTAYLERFPDRVRAMVLDGALDPALAWDEVLAGQAVGFERALAAFLQDCAGSGCAFRAAVDGAASVEDLHAAFDALRARVDEQPLPGDGTRRLGPGELDLAVVSGLYDREHGWPALAEALAAAAVDGEGEQLLALADLYLERGPEGYSPVLEANLAVVCLDEEVPEQVAAYTALAERLRRVAPRFGPALAHSGLTCASWPVEGQGPPAPASAPGAPPVLVVGTTGDPATPYAWSQSLVEQLESAVLLTHVGEGHTVYRVGAPACVLAVVDAYLLTAEPPETTRC